MLVSGSQEKNWKILYSNKCLNPEIEQREHLGHKPMFQTEVENRIANLIKLASKKSNSDK